MRHFNHLSPSLPEAQRIDHDDEPTYPPFTPLNEGEPHGRSTPPTPPFPESDAQEQAVIGNQGDIEREQAQNVSLNSSIRQRFNRDASQSCKGAPFNNNKEGGASPQRYHHPPEELQGQKRIQERNTSFRSPENSPEALSGEEDGQLMASQNVVAQSRSNGRLAGVSTNKTMC